jgi:hypothetical protein
MSQEKIILKDILFNKEKVSAFAQSIKSVYINFDEKKYIEETVSKFSHLELKQRIYHMKDMLKKYLPDDYKTAVGIMLASLPAELDPNKTDGDFGSFIFSPF